MNPSNTVSVASLIAEIQSELKDQTGSWRKVSELLNQADVEFGFGTDEMKQILDQTDISPSKASKLISIAQDDRIKHNSRVFDTVIPEAIFIDLPSPSPLFRLMLLRLVMR